MFCAPLVLKSAASRQPLVQPLLFTRLHWLRVCVSRRLRTLKMILLFRLQPLAYVSLLLCQVKELLVSRFQMPSLLQYLWSLSLTLRSSRSLRWSCLAPSVRPLPTRCSCSIWPKPHTFLLLVLLVRGSLLVLTPSSPLCYIRSILQSSR